MGEGRVRVGACPSTIGGRVRERACLRAVEVRPREYREGFVLLKRVENPLPYVGEGRVRVRLKACPPHL